MKDTEQSNLSYNEIIELLAKGDDKPIGKKVVNIHFDTVKVIKQAVVAVVAILALSGINNTPVAEAIINFMGYSAYPSFLFLGVVVYRWFMGTAFKDDLIAAGLIIPVLTSVFSSLLLNDSGNALGDNLGYYIQLFCTSAFGEAKYAYQFGWWSSLGLVGTGAVLAIRGSSHPLNELSMLAAHGFRKFFGMPQASLRVVNDTKPTLEGLPDPIPQGDDYIVNDGEVPLIIQILPNFGINDPKIIKTVEGHVIKRDFIQISPTDNTSRLERSNVALCRSLGIESISVTPSVSGMPNVISIDTPLKNRQTVFCRELLTSKEWTNNTATIPLLLGVDTQKKPVIGCLQSLKHGILAGASGNGKTAALHSMIIGLMNSFSPEELMIGMIDCKGNELTAYKGCPHIYNDIAFDAERALKTMRKWRNEMERRYKLMREADCNNITMYNQQASTKLPFIIMVADEIADIFSDSDTVEDENAAPNKYGEIKQITMRKAVKSDATKLSKKARAAGMHFLVATQKPTADDIPSYFQSNLTGRICLKTASKKDSKYILEGSPNAFSLLDRGDALMLDVKTSKYKRIHMPFIEESKKELEKMIGLIKAKFPSTVAVAA
jgi:hypothetical protein